MEFSELDLDDRLLNAIEELGYKKPTNIQQEVIPQALSGFDVLGEAPTGTGKTAAFLLPCFQHLIDFPKKKIGLARILILTPTRELALQVAEAAESFKKYLPYVNIGTLIGGVEHEEQLSTLTQKVDIVVATPGRLIEYIRKKSFDIHGIEIMVLDEADRMLDMGFIDDVLEVCRAANRREQTFLFSATLEGKTLTKFANEVLSNPVEIHIDSPRSERKKINQYKYYADDYEHKIKLLEYHLSNNNVDKAIVFVKTRERLMELTRILQKDGFEFVYIRGEMEQSKRIDALSKFTNNTVKIMLATDVAARGIDITDITHVINFDLPRSADIYVHRIGRTARAGAKGSAINLIEAHDVQMLERIEHYTKESITLRVVDELRPKNKIADFTKKKNKEEEKKEKKKIHSERVKDKKNKGKPDFAAKRLKKLGIDNITVDDIANEIENNAKAKAKAVKEDVATSYKTFKNENKNVDVEKSSKNKFNSKEKNFKKDSSRNSTVSKGKFRLRTDDTGDEVDFSKATKMPRPYHRKDANDDNKFNRQNRSQSSDKNNSNKRASKNFDEQRKSSFKDSSFKGKDEREKRSFKSKDSRGSYERDRTITDKKISRKPRFKKDFED